MKGFLWQLYSVDDQSHYIATSTTQPGSPRSDCSSQLYPPPQSPTIRQYLNGHQPVVDRRALKIRIYTSQPTANIICEQRVYATVQSIVWFVQCGHVIRKVTIQATYCKGDLKFEVLDISNFFKFIQLLLLNINLVRECLYIPSN